MQVKPQVTFRDVKHSPEVEQYIHSKIDKMEHYCSHIISCHVVVSADGHHQNGPEHYKAHVKLTVPRKELVSTQSKEANLYKSIDGAFNHIGRQLDDYDKKLNGH